MRFLLLLVVLCTVASITLAFQETAAVVSIPDTDEKHVLLNFECINGILSSSISGLDYIASADPATVYLGVVDAGFQSIELTPSEASGEVRVSTTTENMHKWVEFAITKSGTFESGIPVLHVEVSASYFGHIYFFANSGLNQSLKRLTCAADF